MDLGSDHAVKLLGEHRNIEIRRHPDALSGIQHPGTLFRWSHHEKMVIVDRSIAFIGSIDLCYGRWDTRYHELMDNFNIHPAVDESNASESKLEGSIERKYARWIGKDYRNTFYNKESQTTWDKPFEDYKGVERNEIPRMLWHDVSCAFKGEVVQDAVRHFIDRYKGLVPWWQAFWNSFRVNFQSVVKLFPNIFPPRKSKAEKIVFTFGEHNVNIQFLRSVGKWSAGQEREASIHNAYLDAIRNARHFIYIENQFFISSQEGFWRKVQNRIQSALVERIVRAHKARENFHVMVMTPLKPEFPGDWDSSDFNGDALRAVTFWNQATIYHGEDSLFKKLEKENIPEDIAKNYFSVYSLRKYDLIEGNFVTEIVYVHSKIMIVDDRVAIIGSANINDRSMQGERDSEVAVIIEDLDMLDGKMNGVDFKVGTFAHSLRCDLFKEHLGLLDYKNICGTQFSRYLFSARFVKNLFVHSCTIHVPDELIVLVFAYELFDINRVCIVAVLPSGRTLGTTTSLIPRNDHSRNRERSREGDVFCPGRQIQCFWSPVYGAKYIRNRLGSKEGEARNIYLQEERESTTVRSLSTSSGEV